jgi:uncharacterized protein YbjT (DUF2867 family)
MTNNNEKKILVLGATGFVGRPLVADLLEKDNSVKCLVRDANSAKLHLPEDVELIAGNVLNYNDILKASEDIGVIYYLIHSISSGEQDFEELDKKAAHNAALAADYNHINRIIYLGGLGDKDSESSAHLRSRHDVGDLLRKSNASVTEFRAAVIAGKGGLSFEMVHHLVNRLPVMICPMWVYTKTQPIALEDVIRYLTDCLEIPSTVGKTIDIGGSDILSYGDMMTEMSKALGLKRYLIRIPVLTPRLSSYWVDLVTPIEASYARTLIEGLRFETVKRNQIADNLFDFKPVGFKEWVNKYLGQLNPSSNRAPTLEAIDDSHIYTYHTKRTIIVSPAELFTALKLIGGDHGWYYANWLWKLRGFIDKALGGIGYRKGRDNETDFVVGDRVDFWRIEKYKLNDLLRLRAEMKVWGYGWLEFAAKELGNSKCEFTLQAHYYPRGFWGYLYWAITFPVHVIIFNGIANRISSIIERKIK